MTIFYTLLVYDVVDLKNRSIDKKKGRGIIIYKLNNGGVLMKRYNLSRVCQKGKDFYVLIADPRIIVKLLVNYKAGEEQDTQRPWEEKRVKEIARYVSGKFKDDENKKSRWPDS